MGYYHILAFKLGIYSYTKYEGLTTTVIEHEDEYLRYSINLPDEENIYPSYTVDLLSDGEATETYEWRNIDGTIYHIAEYEEFVSATNVSMEELSTIDEDGNYIVYKFVRAE